MKERGREIHSVRDKREEMRKQLWEKERERANKVLMTDHAGYFFYRLLLMSVDSNKVRK